MVIPGLRHSTMRTVLYEDKRSLNMMYQYEFISFFSNFYSARNARIASAVLATAIPSVRLSVRPSHARIVSKRRHVARCSLHRWIAKCV